MGINLLAARGARAGRTGPAAGAGQTGRAHQGIDLLHAARPIHLQRTRGQGGRLCLAAILDPPRGPAGWRCWTRCASAWAPDSVRVDHRAVRVEQDADGVTVHMTDSAGTPRPSVRGAIVVGCDGIHSALRKQLYPNEGAPRYSGVNMWRGVTRCKPFLSGGSMVRAGWLSIGKMVIYPIPRQHRRGRQPAGELGRRNRIPAEPAVRDWTRQGRLEDFFPAFADWHFDWLDVAALIQNADSVLEYPYGGPGPAAHLDARPHDPAGRRRPTPWCRAAPTARARPSSMRVFLAGPAQETAEHRKKKKKNAALQEYDPRAGGRVTTQVVLTNRSNPPDAILRVKPTSVRTTSASSVSGT